MTITARAMMFAPLRKPIEIDAETYKDLLGLSYKDFWIATHLWGEMGFDSFNYHYAVSEERDNEGTRLNYINYLVNEKGFNV